MPLIVRLPSEEEKDRARRFTVHKNYVSGVAVYLQDRYGSPGAGMLEALGREQRGLKGFRRIQRRSVNEDRLVQYLSLAWASELQFRLAGLSDPSLLQYSNAWAPVHAYYAVYMSAQAWFTASGAEDLVDNHTGSLNALSNQISQRSLFPLPWRVTCTGCPHLDEVEFPGLPDGCDPKSHVEVLATPTLDDFWPRYCKMLETTRRRRLDRHLEEWKRAQNRKNTMAKDKRAVAKKLQPTTIFDFFWRLRVRSNYRDVRTFLMAGVGEHWQAEFYHSLEVLIESTTLLLESLVVASAGPRACEDALREFARNQRSDIPELRQPFERRGELVLA